MSRSIKILIEHLVETARNQGISQGELAQRVGLSSVGLSKAKTRGDIRASSLAAMAKELGLELTLRESRPPSDAVQEIKAGAFFRRSVK